MPSGCSTTRATTSATTSRTSTGPSLQIGSRRSSEAPLAVPTSGRAGFARASVCAAGRERCKGDRGLKFSPDEMARRYSLTRGLMDDHELAALVLFGNSGVNRHNHANAYWLSQYLDMHHSYLLAPRDG